MNILILEDFVHIHDLYRDALESYYNLHFFESIQSLEKRPKKLKPDLVIYDLHLAEGYLFDLIKPEMFGAPFMVVSSKDDEDTIKESFNKGAVDFLTKPFSLCELKVKVDRLFSRFSVPVSSGVIVRYNIAISLDQNVISWQNYSYDLTPKEMVIMRCLLEHAPQGVERGIVSQKLWAGKSVTEKTLNTHFYNLKSKLGNSNLELSYLDGKFYVQFK